MINPTIKLIEGPTANRQKMDRALKALVAQDVLVGVPEKTNRRKEPKVNNAMLAYIHDNGSPLRGIPAREFLRPGIKTVQLEIAARFGQAGRKALEGNHQEVTKGLMDAGLIAQKAVRRKITVGPFKPLKASTLRARRRRGRKGTSPLIDTGQLRQAINFVIRNK